MPKRRSPILEKVKSMMRISSSLSLTKMRKSVRRAKKFELLSTHYEGYGFVREYQISPSDTPLIQTKQRKKRVLDVVFECFRAGIESRGTASEAYFWNTSMAAFPAIGYEVEEEEEEEMENEDECASSVDERAERFIHKFYQQMRMQRLHSSNLILSH